MKFYILTSRDFFALKKHAETIPIEDQVIIINSLDDSYVLQAKDYCIENNIEYHITVSDGTAGTGKNSVMECFLQSDNEYMVQVDGDDILTEYGYKFYTNLSKCKNPPDMVVLKKQWAYISLKWKQLPDGSFKTIQRARTQPWLRDKETQERFLNPVNIFETWRKEKAYNDNGNLKLVWSGTSDEKLMRWAIGRSELERWHWSICEGDEIKDIFSRMTFYSRKAAQHAKFTNKVKVGEDMVVFYEMKRLQKTGELKVFCHDESENITYIYMNDAKNVGVVQHHLSNERSWEWPTILMNYIRDNNLQEKYQSIVGYNLPEIKEEYYGTDS